MAVSDRCVSRQTGEKNEKPARHTKRISIYVCPAVATVQFLFLSLRVSSSCGR